ncbi:MAG: MurR/RpiR family transcriptional regulator [Actinobacteria bacterium]|nr:MurR/RpiR family transcriptional regulator [Actinomycetota bacterium]
MAKNLTLERIARAAAGLTGKQREIATYLLEHHQEVAFLTAAELAERLGVSSATVVRLAQRLGYEGYPDLQRDFQIVVQTAVSPMKKLRQSIEEIEDQGDVLAKVFEIDIENIRATNTPMLREAFSRAADLISGSRRLYVVGMRSSHSLAHYLVFMLGQFLSKVQGLSSGAEDIYDRILDLGEGDAVFVISFPRYTRRTFDLASYARKRGARVIALTDSLASPLAGAADVTLVAANASNLYSFVSAMSILNALITVVGKRHREELVRALELREKVLIEEGIYL